MFRASVHLCQPFRFLDVYLFAIALQALLAMFNDSQSFYFCLDSDLTHSLQRQLNSPKDKHELPLWKRVRRQAASFGSLLNA
jgi:hypothetical protein